MKHLKTLRCAYFECSWQSPLFSRKSLLEKSLGTLFAERRVASFLDVFPRSQGHTLVVLENPSQRLADLSDSDLMKLFSGVKQTQSTLSNYFETTDFTVAIHDGPLAGQEIPHVHVHVIPRKQGDGGRAYRLCSLIALKSTDFAARQMCNEIKEAAQ